MPKKKTSIIPPAVPSPAPDRHQMKANLITVGERLECADQYIDAMTATPKSIDEQLTTIGNRLSIAMGSVGLIMSGDAGDGDDSLADVLEQIAAARRELEALCKRVPYPLFEWAGEPIGPWMEERADTLPLPVAGEPSNMSGDER